MKESVFYAMLTLANLLLTIKYAQVGFILIAILFGVFTAICFKYFNESINKK